MSFDAFHLHPALQAALKSRSFAVPTPIQRQAIPRVLQGRDVLGLAQTGTGKTAAFALPILQKLSSGPRGIVRALVIAPTRELAEQIREDFDAFGRGLGIRTATVYGGVGMQPQVHALRGRCEVVVACPGRLLDHLDRGDFMPGGVEVLVLDEADQMFDMGFLPSVRRILKRLPPKRQTLLFSATMPDELRGLAHDCLRDPVTVQVDHTVPLTTVTHALYPVVEHLKTPLLLALLERIDSESVLVFTRTKHRAKRLAEKVKAAGHEAASLQGNLSQNRRKQALDGFRSGDTHVLVATDIAARGIDVSQISHVVNFDMPGTPEAYTHRIGRTGRAAKTGDAYTLVTDADQSMIRAIESRMGKTLERRRLEGFDYHASAPQGQPHKTHSHAHAHSQAHTHAHAHAPHAGQPQASAQPRAQPHGLHQGRPSPGGSGRRSFWRRRRRPR